MTMKNILEETIVKNEIERIKKVENDAQGRDVDYDISLFKDAVKQIEKLINKKEAKVLINGDMWAECHNSLDKVIGYYGIKHVESTKEMYGSFELRL